MAHHKRKRPKSTRAGCLLCKPHKHQACKGTGEHVKPSERRARQDEREQKAEVS